MDAPLLPRASMAEASASHVDLSQPSYQPKSTGCFPCCMSEPEDPALAFEASQTKVINGRLRQGKNKMNEELTLLLLGAGEAGKSTIFKQIQILHGPGGMPRSERLRFLPIIHHQIANSVQMMVQWCQEHDLPLQPDTEVVAQCYTNIPENYTLTPQHAKELLGLWKDPAIQEAFAHRAEYHLLDSTRYFFGHLDRVALPGCVPTQQDVVHTRVKTTGIAELKFSIRNYEFRVLDVGGQRGERRKWTHCFEDVTGVIFVCSLIEYDCNLVEEETINRMHESLELFNDIVNSPWFAKTSLILFLNKCDLFREKIKTADLRVCFPEYTGGPDEENALQFIKRKFLSQCRHAEQQVYIHTSNATDTSNIKFLFNAVQDIVLQDNLRGSGIL